jgi:hypothetical protein
MRAAGFFLSLFAFLCVSACAYSSPVILLVLFCRKRIGRTPGRALIAVAFAAGTAYQWWRIEWFDVWRHGTPPLSYLIVYAPYMIATGTVGWLVGGLLLRQSKPFFSTTTGD